MNVCRAQVESLEGEIAMTQLTEAAHCQQASDASARSVRCREELLKCVDTMLGGGGERYFIGDEAGCSERGAETGVDCRGAVWTSLPGTRRRCTSRSRGVCSWRGGSEGAEILCDPPGPGTWRRCTSCWGPMRRCTATSLHETSRWPPPRRPYRYPGCDDG